MPDSKGRSRWVGDYYLEREPVVDRIELFGVIEEAGLTQALLTHLQRNAQELVDAGADAGELRSMRAQDFKEKVFPTLPRAAVKVIVRWLAEMSKGDYERFKEESLRPEDPGEGAKPKKKKVIKKGKLVSNEEQESPKKSLEVELCRFLMPLRMKRQKMIDGTHDMQRRARVFLAALADDEQEHTLAMLLSLHGRSSRGDDSSQLYMLLRASIDAPEELLRNHEEATKGNITAFGIGCAAAIRARDRDMASRLLRQVEKLERAEGSGSSWHGLLTKFHQRTMPKQHMRLTRLERCPPDRFKSAVGLEVLAECNRVEDRELNSYAFSRVVAVRDPEEGVWHELDDATLKRLFPKSGSVIHLQGKDHPHLPRHASHAVWEVARQPLDTDSAEKYNTHMRMSRRICPAHRILNLEHIASTEHSLARQWLKNTSDLDVDAEGEMLLRFEDGIFIRTTSSYHLLVEQNFTHSLKYWQDLPMLDVGSGVILHVGDLPESLGDFHLMPPVSELGRKIRQMEGITARDKDAYAKAVAEMGLNHALDSRLSGLKLGDMVLDGEQLGGIVDLLSESEAYREEVERVLRQQDSESATRLSEAEAALANSKAILERTSELIEKKREVLERADAALHENENELRDRVMSDKKLHWQLMQLYSQASTDKDIEERLERLERILLEEKG